MEDPIEVQAICRAAGGVTVTGLGGNTNPNAALAGLPTEYVSPPPPPPATNALVTASTYHDEGGGAFSMTLTLDSQISGFDPFLGANPWVLKYNGVAQIVNFSDVLPTTVFNAAILGIPAAPVTVTIPPGESQMRTESGGIVEPGIYTLTLV